MRKLAFSLALLFAGAFSAQADVLYWMMDTEGVDVVNCGTWQYATISAVDQDGRVELVNVNGGATTYKYDALAEGFSVGSSLASIATPANYSYLIELWNDTGTRENQVGRAMYSYNDIQSYIEMSVLSPADAFIASGFAAVPEPTSGLLFLMGGVLLGLRRRRMA